MPPKGGEKVTDAASPASAQDEMAAVPVVKPVEMVSVAEGDETMGGGAVSDDSDDEVADFRNLLPQLLADKGGRAGDKAEVAAGSLPKRGEKDFEPTGFRGQEKKLEESRRAMEMVIGQDRRTSSKTLSTAIWYPSLGRAVVGNSKGVVMASVGVTVRSPVRASSSSSPSAFGSADVIGPDNQIGVWKAGIFYPRYTSQLELLPEEALFLLERGSLEVKTPMKLEDTGEEVQVPLSLQHAFALMLGRNECTRERYQVYAYLKRLGYYVQRREVSESLRETARLARLKDSTSMALPDQRLDQQLESNTGALPKGIVADRRRPIKLVTIFDLLLYVPRRFGQLIASAASAIRNWIALIVRRILARRQQPSGSQGRSKGLLGIDASAAVSFDSIYSSLQIIPSGHERDGASTVPSVKSTDGGFEPFFYAWRPATHFKKTDPPLPEFRIAIVPARSTVLPKLKQFEQMFSAVPLEAELSGDLDEEEKERARIEKKRNDESYGRGFLAKKRKEEGTVKPKKKSGQTQRQASGAPALSFLAKFLPVVLMEQVYRCVHAWHRVIVALSRRLQPYLPFLFGAQAPGRRPEGGMIRPPRRPNPFPPLKAGRRNVILAIVDHGTTSMLRFGEAEFEKWKLMGTEAEEAVTSI